MPREEIALMDVYTVPEAVLFRNFEVLSASSGQQTRNLLLQNKTNAPLQAFISYPFSDHFRLHAAPPAQTLHPTPPHVAVTVHPGSPTKLVLELRVPDNADLNYVQGESSGFLFISHGSPEP